MQISITKIRTYKGHEGSVYSLEQSSFPQLFFSGSSDKMVTEWNLLPEGTPKAIVNVGSIIYSLRHIPERKLLLIGVSGGGMHVIDLEKKQEIKFLVHHKNGIFDIAISLVHKRIYTASGDGSMAVWSLDDFSLMYSLVVGKEKVRSVRLNADESEIAVASGDGMLRFFDPLTMAEKIVIKGHELSANTVAYHPASDLIVSGGRDAYLKLWDAKSYRLLRSIPAHNFAIYGIEFSPDGRLAATASRDKTIKIWDASTFEILARIDKEKYDGHANSVNKILWTKYNNYLLSAGDDRSVMVWEVKALNV
ncbi:MAG TPA: WD40 repeat domain-containing protein [Bacteroidia bacterium]|nr:WD40 repeat domain-containing protein [Bacteroidia bacterium]